MRTLGSIVTYCLMSFAGTLYAQTLPEDERKQLVRSIVNELKDSLRQEIKSGTISDTVNYSFQDPFSWGDFSWVQGNNRQKNALLQSRYFTGSITLDMNYNYSFNRPIDHTNSGSTATFRSNEFNISYIEAGGDFHYKNVRARLMLQFGTRATGVPRNDNTPLRGQFDLYTAMRFVTEGYAGYHLDVWKGINIDAGIFKSYVGLLSYNNFENWNYQPSFTSDNTPWFFTGIRVQTFPSTKLKIEYWIVNGWQSYGMFNEAPGLGTQVQWRPKESVSLLSSFYGGYDTPNMPGRFRFHTDNSAVIRYYHAPGRKISKAAFSVTADFGFENGDGVTAFGRDGKPAQNFISGMIYHRLWMAKEKLGWTIGGGYINNPGRYLALLPAGNAVLTQNPGDKFNGWDFSTSFQFMPNENVTWGLEMVTRHANVPYFSGRGGVTSPNGWNAPIGDPSGYVADLVKHETRIIASMIVRF
ncbi:MAG: porin [Cyclobacteriaceae bacterium]|nr:porin [Cyclobacteriaceae bacterium]